VNSLGWINFERFYIANEESVMERTKDLSCSSLMPVCVVKFPWWRSFISVRFIVALWRGISFERNETLFVINRTALRR